MAKRMQEQKEEETIVAKSNSSAMKLSSHVPTSSSSAKSPIASKSMGTLIVTERMRRNSKSDAASSSQVRLQMDTVTEKLVATNKESGDVDLSEPETGSLHEEEVTERPVAYKTAGERPYASSKSDHLEVQKLKEWNGHIIDTFLQPQFIIWNQSCRSSGISTDENMTTLWMIWTWMWLFGAFFREPLFKQQFILDKTMWRIYDSRRIFGTVKDSYSMKTKNLSVNKKKSLV